MFSLLHVYTEISQNVWSWKFGLKSWKSTGQHVYEPCVSCYLFFNYKFSFFLLVKRCEVSWGKPTSQIMFYLHSFFLPFPPRLSRPTDIPPLSTSSPLSERGIAASWWSSVCGRTPCWTRYNLLSHLPAGSCCSRPVATRPVVPVWE